MNLCNTDLHLEFTVVKNRHFKQPVLKTYSFDFSTANNLFDNDATKAGTQSGSLMYAARKDIHRFSIAASLSLSN